MSIPALKHAPTIPVDRAGVTLPERRRSTRLQLHWTVYLKFTSFGQPVRTRTENINKHGFYCLLRHPINLGERIECDIVVPTHATHDECFRLRCQVQAVRVERIGTGAAFGLACVIQDYSVINR
jgi:hypothetical protein